MLKIGEMNELVAERRLEFGFYLTCGEEEVLLPNKYVPGDLSIGDSIRVFVYTDSEDRLLATTLTPKAMVGDYALLKVKDVTDFGTFFDWGLEKDLLVPLNQQRHNMAIGQRHVVRLCLDETTRRVYGTTRISRSCKQHTNELLPGQEVHLLIYNITRLGYQAVINQCYDGMVHKNEIFTEITIGDQITGYISKIREDGKIDLVLKKPGYTSISVSAEKIITALENAGGFMPCTDKTVPEEIYNFFSMSKKEFKRAAGNLLKTGKILMTDKGISLKTPPS
ncbi:S1-like domain-containing RNA-binding protein [Desulfobotulus sp. H1]|uniref:S1-like domain-containing RNA-binding protein n=1 Tax=Desulfobotulus pelophilus TaxID=2823377 RepID=A0ABT3N8H0_9BACT|nr:S1-like domain-containing RNA-binding protein [Desulfobotulus pelophilus]MCW7753756.1 S1-like domain-containing RNA-binding protein [Desulfobotulus pelophilus]